jgi:hypothetical protein
VGAAFASDHTLHVADAMGDGALVINTFLSGDARLLGLAPLSLDEIYQPSIRFPAHLLACEMCFCVALGRSVAFVAYERPPAIIPVPSDVTQLIASAPHTRARIAVAMEQGGLILWGDHAAAPRTPFASEMIEPRIALTPGGLLAAASKDEIDVYATGGGQLELHARLPGNGAAPLAVLSPSSALGASQFAIVYCDGRVAIHRVTST